MESTKLTILPDAVIEAIRIGNSGSLEMRHAKRAYDIDRTSRGNVQFSVDRHPHLLGRPTVGKASPAYKEVLTRYEWDHETRLIRVVEEREIAVHIDVIGLVAETMDNMRECGFDGTIIKEIESWTSEDIAIEQARILAEEIDWTIDIPDEVISSEDVQRYVAGCVTAYAELLINEWRTLRE